MNEELAFPVNELDQVSGHIYAQHLGMSLRDYFAAKAMQGILAGWRDGDPCRAAEIADMAYNVADAMLSARP